MEEQGSNAAVEVEVSPEQLAADSRAAVARGIAWLDETGRSDWYEIVDWHRFNFMDGKRCILGQLVGDVFGPLGGLGMTHGKLVPWAQDHGFVDRRFGYHDGKPFTDGAVLAEAWREAGAALLMGCRWEA